MTDFGIPTRVPRADANPLTARRSGPLESSSYGRPGWSWTRSPRPPRRRRAGGPRGGGRDRDKMLDHVLGAEAAYARQLGIKHPQPQVGAARPSRALRDDPDRGPARRLRRVTPAPRGWPPRYALRRITWHVLDHAWEMQDRRDPDG